MRIANEQRASSAEKSGIFSHPQFRFEQAEVDLASLLNELLDRFESTVI